MSTLEVILAHSAGTCFGVERAIEMAERERKPILGPIVHNPLIVDDLARQGIPVLERTTDLAALREQGITEVIITAHGCPRELKEELDRQGIRYHDATCPVLEKWVYGKIRDLEAEGCTVILVGNPDHAEIIATRSYGRGIHVVYSDEDVAALPSDLEKTVAICQTTITQKKFDTLVARIRETRCPDLTVVDTRCKPVRNQQEAVERLAQWVDAMIIVGGYDSSNTSNLARIARTVLPDRTYHVDSDELIQASWLREIRHLGIGAGTSTPKQQIRAVQRRIEELHEGPVRFRYEARDEEAEP